MLGSGALARPAALGHAHYHHFALSRSSTQLRFANLVQARPEKSTMISATGRDSVRRLRSDGILKWGVRTRSGDDRTGAGAPKAPHLADVLAQ
jgi:hypothetical protein